MFILLYTFMIMVSSSLIGLFETIYDHNHTSFPFSIPLFVVGGTLPYIFFRGAGGGGPLFYKEEGEKAGKGFLWDKR